MISSRQGSERVVKNGLLAAVLFLLISLSVSIHAGQKLKTENVILVTIDGFRWQEIFSGPDSLLLHSEKYCDDIEALRAEFWHPDPAVRREKLLPFFWSVIGEKGQLYGNRKKGSVAYLTNPHIFSYPGYTEILVGYVDTNMDSNAKRWNPNRTVLEFVNDLPRFRGKVAAFCSWDVFPYIINSKRSGIPVSVGDGPPQGIELSQTEAVLYQLQQQIPPPWGSVRWDAITYHLAFHYLKQNRPRLLYIAFDETDDYAHDGKYGHYLRSAHKTDSYLSTLWSWIQSDRRYRNRTTLIITTDHGRGESPLDSWRNHGDEVEGAEEVWIAVVGPDTPAHGEIQDQPPVFSNQIAASVAALLGLTYASVRPTGVVMQSLFTDE
ncbi:MAG: alkaline phosphatase family protein [Candidatus Marinimicrobia bacterium]|jgi:hypothetical protein|nr:alkaline phosphatase family protein [Candidatus Neomarinimicrobiota bacterium]MDP6594194.1 alkaline phosphatase family protein [Candidatus Neomarinimicrobiota bacterium]MDP6837033.1 alkaline phosphatase family protein [Candidatus Neomarinimicrobiota bacterium]MDP6965907.1 alkaline phosphatase family protein [Candidatus Neomarinimicrobiota bacterium]|tara:strand:+ start:887 stop:2023 length:1137 start_codon:yes stop_codon:yes gene_type:complete